VTSEEWLVTELTECIARASNIRHAWRKTSLVTHH